MDLLPSEIRFINHSRAKSFGSADFAQVSFNYILETRCLLFQSTIIYSLLSFWKSKFLLAAKAVNIFLKGSAKIQND